MGAAEQNFTWIIKKPDLFYKSGFVYYLLNQKENRLAFASRFMLALPIFLVRARIVAALKNVLDARFSRFCAFFEYKKSDSLS